MTNQQFLQQFGHFIEAPNGVEKLREIIYALAAAGRLIESEDKTKYELGDIADFVMGQAPPGNECNKDGVGTIFVKTGEFGSLYPEVREWTTKPLKKAKDGDILICVVGATIGKLNLAIDCAIGRSVAAIRPCDGVDTKFLYISLMPYVLRLRAQSRGSAQGTITKTELNSVEIRVPPLPEQHRIVAKVDELMSLCDQMEVERNARKATHQRLIRAVHHPLTEATDTTTGIDSLTAWHRIRDNFADLYTTLESVQALRQTILQLAVQGKLVPQDTSDEPVSELIGRIESHKNKRVASKEIQKPKVISIASKPRLHIPEGWQYLSLNEAAFVTKLAGFEYTKYINLKDSGVVPVVRAQNVRPFNLDKTNLKFIDLDTSNNLTRSALDRPALLVTFIGAGIGDVCIFNEKDRWHLAPNVAKVEPYSNTSLEYLNIYLNSPEGRHEIFKSIKSTAQPSLSMGTIREIWIPLPPVDEQYRIVDKINELMALCDQLETNIRNKNDTATRYAEAIVQQIAAA